MLSLGLQNLLSPMVLFFVLGLLAAFARSDLALTGILSQLAVPYDGLLAVLTGLSVGSTAVLITLAASASYIAVPAAMRLALPAANPALALTLSLGVTFPFNVLVGIPLYIAVCHHLGCRGGQARALLKMIVKKRNHHGEGRTLHAGLSAGRRAERDR